MKVYKKIQITLCALAACFAVAGNASEAADFPTKPVTLIVPYGAGGSTDTMGRVFAKALKKELGQPVVVVNRKGGGGAVGASFLKTAKADGYTILLGGVDEIVVWIANTKEVNFSKDDFRYLGGIANYQNAFVTANSQPFKSFKGFVEFAKKNPGTAVVSQGGMDKLFLEKLMDIEDIRLKLVPTSGGTEAMQFLLAGNAVLSYSGGVHTNYEGAVSVLASLNEKRLSGAPDKPTFEELGYALTFPSLVGVMASANVPDDIAKKLEKSVLAAAQSSDFLKIVQQRLKSEAESLDSPQTTAVINKLESSLQSILKK